MARPREFNETDAVRSAMLCFWQRGYEATSMRDLAASMGMSAPSLYNAFGDKEKLFTRALELYLDYNAREFVLRLESSLPPKEAIRQFFAEIVDHSIKDRERKGCFLVNSALEVASHKKELTAVISKQFSEIEGFFKRCIVAAQAKRTVPQSLDASDTARMLLGVLLGVRVLARSAPNRSLLESVVRSALAPLDLPIRQRKKKR